MFNKVFKSMVLMVLVVTSRLDNIYANRLDNAMDIVESNGSNTEFDTTVGTTVSPTDRASLGDEITSLSKKPFWWGLASVSAATVGAIVGLATRYYSTEFGDAVSFFATMTLVWCISSIIWDLNKQPSAAVKHEIDLDAEYLRNHKNSAEISICNAGGIERRSIVGDIDTIRAIMEIFKSGFFN